MSCHAIGNVTVCAPSGFAARRVLWCPTCGQRRRMVVTSYVWYGPTVMCCGCGETWHDGYRSRPFRRGWRTDAIRQARVDYQQAQNRRVVDAALRTELDTYRSTN